MSQTLSEMSLEELWALFPIRLTEHQDCWAAWYAEKAETLERILSGQHGLRIHHIGSTAINGIWAKPIVDLLIELPDRAALRAAKERMESCGCICMSDQGDRVSLNQGYTESGLEERVFHFHLRLAGDHDELFFRDYLRAHPEAAKKYEALKISLWKTYPHDRDRYTAGKTEFVMGYTKLAKEQYGAADYASAERAWPR